MFRCSPPSGLTPWHLPALSPRSDLPRDILDPLLTCFSISDQEVIPFDDFRYGVLTCLVFEDFFHHAERLFKGLDASGTGRVDRQVFAALMENVLDTSESPLLPSDVAVLEESVGEALTRGRGVDDTNSTVSYQEFLAGTFNTFQVKGCFATVSRS